MASSPRPTTPNSQKKRSGRRQLHRSSGAYNILPQSPKIHYPVDPDNLPLEAPGNTEKFELLSDALEELDVNMTNLQLIHEAISDGFNESFASFLYGLSITMWCVDFPGCPSRDQWEKLKLVEGLDDRILELAEKIRIHKEENERLKKRLTSNVIESTEEEENHNEGHESRKPTQPHRVGRGYPRQGDSEGDDTYMTNEGSFVVNPSVAGATRIPQPVKTVPRRLTKHTPPPPAETSMHPNNRGPNLNQPPRYMRGLFDSTNRPTTPANNRSKRVANTNRVQKATSRPPFR
mmetsp:Transcript_3757/g.4177  ORF Transcript_3757/g.4177 Transcript_3757/m.4177 type:complete len:291 (+) Transcript_3757:1674-2546(+)